MSSRKPLTALGLMSGTSLDGIDAAIISTDGERVFSFGPVATAPYDPAFRADLRALLGTRGNEAVAAELTRRHAQAVRGLLADNGLTSAQVDLIGFHGQTVLHEPEKGLTRQIGDGAGLARETGIAVVSDFRSNDMANGGEGAPLAPLFHAALARDLEKPLAVLNLGGVGNVTWIGEGETDLLAFDTGPGNALLDDWTVKTIARPMDEGGRLGRAGRADEDILAGFLDHSYFAKTPPKSLDRDTFSLRPLEDKTGISAQDGAATLTAFTARAVAASVNFFPSAPKRWLVGGGGRRNGYLMETLKGVLGAPVDPVETVGWNGDALEAQAFAFLAVRSFYGLPLSLPTTTGVFRPVTGGVLNT